MFAPGQWLNYPTPGTPRGADGKPNLSAKTPRAANGRPDLSGVWRTVYDSPRQNERLFGAGVKAFIVPGDDPSWFPEYLPRHPGGFPARREADASRCRGAVPAERVDKANSSSARCLPQGLPRTDMNSYAPFKIFRRGAGSRRCTRWTTRIDRSTRTAARFRSIRNLRGAATQSANGTAIRWSSTRRDSTKDVAGLRRPPPQRRPARPGAVLPARFRPHGLERDRRRSQDVHPAVYVKVTEMLLPDTDILESVCNENEKDRAHLDK